MTEPESIVVLGAGQAGGWAAKTLRDQGFRGRVTLIGDEAHAPHERPPLSKAVLAGEAAPESTHLFKPAALDALDLDWRRGVRVDAIDRARRSIALDDGTALAYDRLILCMGGRARALAVPGSERVRVHTLRSIDDALALRDALSPQARMLVVGGGWIGLEVAATARKRGASVRVVEYAPRLCPRVLPAPLSAHLCALHARHGVEVSLGRSIARLAPAEGTGVSVTLDDGETFVVDCIVAGVGLVANDELARAAGLECAGGVVVDMRCATSDPDIYAAGDVAVAPNGFARGRIRLESWQNAQDQAIAAARSALGQDVRYDPIPRFWSDQYDVNIQMLGWFGPDDRLALRGDPSSGRFVGFALDGARVRAAIAFNAARELRAAKRLIESGAEVDVARLVDPGVDLGRLS